MKSKGKKTGYLILEIIFIIIFAVSLVKVVKIGYDYYKWKNFYDKTKSSFVKDSKGDDFQVDLASLQKENPDIVGWIDIKGTPISYPLLWSESNDTYLRHTYTHEWSNFGSIFIDAANDRNLQDQHTIIYGHDTRDGSMFGTLKKYKDVDYLREHPYVDIYLNNVVYKYKIISAYTTEADSDTYRIRFEDPYQYRSWFDYIVKSSEVEAKGNLMDPANKVITLSTCTSRTPTERFVVNASLVKKIPR